MNATAELTKVAKATILRLLEHAGRVASAHHDRMVRNVPSQRIQMDEVWSFVYCKEKHAAVAKAPGHCGDIWTWTALCADTRLLVACCVGDRSATYARAVMLDLKERLAHPRFQLTTDGHGPYLNAVEHVYGIGLDYAQLVKTYGTAHPDCEGHDHKYSPPRVTGIHTSIVTGHPDPTSINTSFVERHNLTIRMHLRRFTRLTNAHWKKLENHAHALAVFPYHYNFVCIHQTLRVTPAMEAGLTDRLWDFSDLVDLIEEATPPPGPRGPYRKREISD